VRCLYVGPGVGRVYCKLGNTILSNSNTQCAEACIQAENAHHQTRIFSLNIGISTRVTTVPCRNMHISLTNIPLPIYLKHQCSFSKTIFPFKIMTELSDFSIIIIFETYEGIQWLDTALCHVKYSIKILPWCTMSSSDRLVTMATIV